MRLLGKMRWALLGLLCASVVPGAASLVSTASATPPKAKCLIVNQRTDLRYPTLQAANDAAETVAGDTVMVKGTCVGTTILGKNLNIVGKSNPGFGVATLDGDNMGTVVTVSPGIRVEITGVKVTGGNGNSVTVIHGTGNSGGGVFNNAGSLVLSNMVVTGNTAGNGGGIYNFLGSLTMINSTVSDNIGNTQETPFEFVSYQGGGIFNGGCHPFIECSSQAAVTITNSTITHNAGGGIVNGYAASLALENSTVSNNTAMAGAGIRTQGQVALSGSAITGNTATAGSGGGLLAVRFGAATLTNSSVSGNTAAADGGGIALFLAGLTLTNSTVAANTATHHGGGILNSGGGAWLTNSTVTGNRLTSPDGRGGGIYNEDAGLNLTNSTVVGNIPDNIVFASL